MLRVLLPTTLATNKIAASWVNTNFRLGKITGVGTPYTEVTSLAAKQVCFGPVKAQHVQILLQNVELFSTLCNNYSQPAATWFVARTLASFSLQRLWFRAQIGGTRKVPLVARKTNSGMKVPPIQCAKCGQLLVYLPGFKPSSFVSLSAPVRKVLFKNKEALLHRLLPSWTFWSKGFPSVDVNAQGFQVPLADIYKA